MSGGNSNHIRTFFVIRGGIAIHNPNSDQTVPGGAYGTIGCLGTSDGSDRWIISCYHVLCRNGADFPAATAEPIYHPVSQLRPTPVATVGADRGDRGLDCAAALVLATGQTMGQILGVGRLSNPIEPALGMRVIKSGAETGVTEGRIVKASGNVVEVAPLGYPSGYELCEGGDSGAIWIDTETYSPVALQCRGSDHGTPERAFGVPMPAVLASLRLRLVIEG